MTATFEEKLLRGPLWPLRMKLNLRNTKRKPRPDQRFQKEVIVGGKPGKITVTYGDWPEVLALPNFGVPPFISGCEPLRPNTFRSMLLIPLGGRSIQEIVGEFSETHKVESVSLEHPNSQILLQFVAKVLHGFAKARLPESFTPLLQKAILGLEPVDLMKFVGDAPTIPKWSSTLNSLRKEMQFLCRLEFHFGESGVLDVVGYLYLPVLGFTDGFVAKLGTMPSASLAELKVLHESNFI